MGKLRGHKDNTVGWFAVMGTFLSWFAWIGMVKGVAVMLPTLQDQFDSQTWLVGWMVAVLDGFIDAAGPLASPIQRRFGVRIVVMVSGVFVGVSFLVSSFVSTLLGMTLALALLAAPAIGVSNIVTREMIGQYFTETHTRAMGIGASGASAAFVVFAPLTQFLLDLYGWRGVMLVLGALMFHITVCGALFRPNKKRNTHNDDYRLVNKDGSADAKRPAVYGFRSIWTLFASLDYWLVVLVTTCTTVTATAWVVYFASNVNQSKDFSLADTSIIVAIFGVGKIVGNVVAVLFDSCQAVSTNAWVGLVVLGSSACFLVDPLLHSYWPVALYAFTYGCFHGCTYTLLDVLTKRSVGSEQFGSALGWIGLKAGLARTLFVFFPGLIYDTYGSYTLAFILLSGINALALPAVVVLAWREKRN